MTKSNYGVHVRHKSAAMLILLVTPIIIMSACNNPAPDPGTAPKPTISPKLIALSLDQLADRADTILIGTVTGKESRRDAQGGNIYTLVTLKTEQQIKGQPAPETVSIRVQGGELDGISQKVEDSPLFQQGEKVIVFLTAGDGGTMTVVGGLQGKGVIENGTVTSVVQTLSGLQVERVSAMIKEQMGK